ncbi:Flavoprotein desaturase PigA [Pandoraea captiosa]|uniref:Flavoprotein desaturase PigA n=1 Tax=Pandoraea captiosa TaxID=2508302 RepID=A0A5E5A8X8_9BURK|nr:acyl-CoA dehydrogenase family protein [Pandoraea captiosa]VVE70054.1 Flavoprotein desaturase PigA [Pandoraea captiosa]
MIGAQDFSLTPDQLMIQESAAQFLDDRSASAMVRTAMESASGFDASLWTAMSKDLGWTGTHIPEAYGGLDLSFVELTLLLEQMGRRLACSPFFATVVMGATTLMMAADHETKARLLPQIASGELTATVGFGARGVDWDPAGVTAVAETVEGGYRLSGGFRHVPDGSTAALLLLVARLNGEIALFSVDANADGVTAREHANLDRTRRIAHVTLDGVIVDSTSLICRGTSLNDALARVRAMAGIALASEQLGAAQQCLDMTLAYAAERVQFGRPINSFQAVKHRCAEMMVKIEATRSAIYGAARFVTTTPDTASLLLEAACAKTFASEALFFCAQEAIQLHGGVGFTWEYDPHLYFKRAQASSQWFGSPAALREEVAVSLLDAARPVSCQ